MHYKKPQPAGTVLGFTLTVDEVTWPLLSPWP